MAAVERTRVRRALLLLLALGLVAAGCGTHPPRPGALEEVAPGPATGRRIAERALAYLGAPYRRGGTSEEGFDCSGLVQRVFLDHGVALPRTADEQSATGAVVAPEELAPGDLVFFRASGPKPTHVGIYVGRGQFVHAPGRGSRVRLEQLSSEYFRRRFAGARRIVPG